MEVPTRFLFYSITNEPPQFFILHNYYRGLKSSILPPRLKSLNTHTLLDRVRVRTETGSGRHMEPPH